MILLIAVLSCRGEPVDTAAKRAEMLDPQTCAECHPAHTEEWSGSMHAYASTDPVFRAMNARGQEETDGELGDFCVQCHAPMALLEGETEDGLNLDEVPEHLQGVTCYFCHSVGAVTGEHNAALTLTEDLVMRGGISDPATNAMHLSTYSPLLDRNALESADMCGSCHDIVTPNGVHMERTYLEWQDSIYSEPTAGLRQTCGQCHMQGRDDVAAEGDNVGIRRVHSHTMVGVDIALQDFPQAEAQLAEVQKALDTVVYPTLNVCDNGAGTEVTLTLENLSAGHSWPSGAAPDRRAWVEIEARTKDKVILSVGSVEEGEPMVDVEEQQGANFWRLGDRLYDESGQEVHMFWEAASYETALLPAPTFIPSDDPGSAQTHLARTWWLPGQWPDAVEARVHIRPMGLDILDNLIESGHLAAEYRDAMPTFTLAASQVAWSSKDGNDCE